MQMTIHVADNVDDLITSLEQVSNDLFEWIKNNLLKSNSDKCHLLVILNEKSKYESRRL